MPYIRLGLGKSAVLSGSRRLRTPARSPRPPLASTVAPPCVAAISGGDHGTHAARQGRHRRQPRNVDGYVGPAGRQDRRARRARHSNRRGAVILAGDLLRLGRSGDDLVHHNLRRRRPRQTSTCTGPNTMINVYGITLVLNGQSAVPGTDERLRVNAIHIKAVGLLEVIIGSATSDIHNCCPSPASAAGPLAVRPAGAALPGVPADCAGSSHYPSLRALPGRRGYRLRIIGGGRDFRLNDLDIRAMHSWSA